MKNVVSERVTWVINDWYVEPLRKTSDNEQMKRSKSHTHTERENSLLLIKRQKTTTTACKATLVLFDILV